MYLRNLVIVPFLFVVCSFGFYGMAQSHVKSTDTVTNAAAKKTFASLFDDLDYFKSTKDAKSDTALKKDEWIKSLNEFLDDSFASGNHKISSKPKVDINKITITPQTKENTCLSGNCIDGFGTNLIMNTTNVKLTYTGDFKNGERNGEGEILWRHPNPNDHSVNPGLFTKSISQGTYKNGSLIQGESIIFKDNDEFDMIQKEEGRFEDNNLKEGTRYIYKAGSKKGMYIKYEGNFAAKDFIKGTATLHGYAIEPDITYSAENFIDGKICLSGNCENGNGFLVTNEVIYKGKFKKGHFREGLLEKMNCSVDWGNGLYTLSGKWTDQKAQGTYKKYLTGETGECIFTPAGTSDNIKCTIYSDNDINGSLRFGIIIPMSYFKQDDYQKVIAADGAPAWISNVYAAYRLKYNQDEQASKDAYYKQLRDEQARKNSDPFYYGFNGNSSSNSGSGSGSNTSSASSKAHIPSKHTCITCNGSGFYNNTDRYGHTIRGFCTRCNGLGYTEF